VFFFLFFFSSNTEDVKKECPKTAEPLTGPREEGYQVRRREASTGKEEEISKRKEK
jgi:hypothetical protein